MHPTFQTQRLRLISTKLHPTSLYNAVWPKISWQAHPPTHPTFVLGMLDEILDEFGGPLHILSIYHSSIECLLIFCSLFVPN